MTRKKSAKKYHQIQTIYLTLMTVIIGLFMMTYFGELKEVNAASDEITEIVLETDSPIQDTFDEYSYVQQPNIYIKSVESKNGTVKKNYLEVNEIDYYGWCQFDGVDDWCPYSEDGVQNLYFTSGESRFMANIYVVDSVTGVKFADDCQVTVNGITMNLYKKYDEDDEIFYFSQSATHIYEKDVVEEISLELKSKSPATGLKVGACNPFFNVTKIKLKSGKIVDNGIIELKGVWLYKSGEDNYTQYSYGDTFFGGENRLKLTLSINPKVSSGYKLDSNLTVYLGSYSMNVLFGTVDGQKMELYETETLYDPEIYVYANDLNGSSGSKVSLDGINYDSSCRGFYPATSTTTFYAKPDADSEFVEWRKGSSYDGEAIGTNPTITVTVDGNENYYAIFQKKMKTEGILNETVKYTFDKATGTVTLIPTLSDGNGGYTGVASVSEYRSSPFYKNTGVKRVIINEGINQIGDYVFQDNTLEYVSIPKSLTYITDRAFEHCKFYGVGFEVADGNENYKEINGSLATRDGSKLIKYFQKPGEKEYAIPDGVTCLGWYCFENCELDKLTLKNEGLWLDNYAICIKVKRMVIEEGVKNLGWGSSFECENTTMYIPASVENVGFSNAFLDGEKLVNIEVSEDSPYYTSIAGVLYQKTDEGLILVKYPYGKTGSSYVTPQNVIGVSTYAITDRDIKNLIFTEKVSSLENCSISYLKDAKVIIKNPDCKFLSDIYDEAIEDCSNLTICGVIGSTAQIFAEKEGYSFEAIGENKGKLSTPKNLKWDGCVAKWDKVDNSTRYNVTFYKDEDNDGVYDKYKSYNVDDDKTEYDFSSMMFYKNYKYYFTVQATAPYYDMSDIAESPSTIGRFSTGKIQNLNVSGDTLSFTPYKDDEGDGCYYQLYVYDNADNYVNQFYYNTDKTNLREYFKNYSISPYAEYKIYIRAFVDSAKTEGYQILAAETDTPVTYNYKDISPVSQIYITIPEPHAGENAMLEDLKIKAYCGEDQLDGIRATNNYWDNSYRYKETEEDSWTYFDSSEGILKNKYAYDYEVTLDAVYGYTIKDGVEIFVNDEKTNVTIKNFDPAYVSIRYEFPVGTKAYEYIKTANVTGEYTKPVVGEDIKDPENVQATEDGLIVKDVYWIEKENNEWKTIKVSGKFEADKEYAIYVELKADEENDYRLEQPGLDSYKIFGDDEAKCDYYTFSGASFIKIIGKPDAAPTPTPTATPTTDVDASPTPSATPDSTAPSVSPSPAVPSASPEVTATPEPVGTTLTDTKGKAKYKVISAGKTDPADPSKNELPAVSYTGTTNKKAKKITVPDTVTLNGLVYKVETIGAGALKKNKKITTVTIGKNVKVIEKNAFAGCPKLKTVNCKSKVLYKIGANAFKDDSKLNKIILKTKLLKKKNVGKNAIKGTSKKLKIYTPKEVKKSYQKIFKAKGNKKVKTK